LGCSAPQHGRPWDGQEHVKAARDLFAGWPCGCDVATWEHPHVKDEFIIWGGNFGDLQNGWFDGLFHGKSIYKWMIWGYHHLWKAPFIEYGKIGMNQVQMSHSERGVPIFA